MSLLLDVCEKFGDVGRDLGRVLAVDGVGRVRVDRDGCVGHGSPCHLGGHRGVVHARGSGEQREGGYRSLIGYLHAHPEHARVIIEAINGVNAVTDRPHTPSRQQTVADLVEAAKAAGQYRHDLDAVTTSIMINGAVDAIVSQHLEDPEFDSNRAADQLIDPLSQGLRARV